MHVFCRQYVELQGMFLGFVDVASMAGDDDDGRQVGSRKARWGIHHSTKYVFKDETVKHGTRR